MRQFALAAAFVIAALPSQAQQSEIEAVIDQQLDAFVADDFGTAFTYASPTIRGLFGTAENFGRMVRNGYPMVHRPDSVEYLDLDDLGTVKRQRVLIRDRAGAFHTLEYDMIELDDGWRVNGVRILAAPQVGA